jgi:hypothetical protein
MRNEPKERQDHKMQYLGAYTVRNVASLKKQQGKPKRKLKYFIGHDKRARSLALSDKPNGIWFFCVERAKKGSGRQFFVIQAEYDETDLLLPTPLPLDFERHTDGKGIFSPPRFGDGSARRLLHDLAKINPEKRLELEQLWRCYREALNAGV